MSETSEHRETAKADFNEVVLRWWSHLQRDRGARAALRHCHRPAEVALTDYVRNTYSALQGGLSGVLAETACCGIAECLLGRRPSTRDLRIRYLSQGRVGPFETETEVLRQNPKDVLARVRIVDRGAENRLVALASCTVG